MTVGSFLVKNKKVCDGHLHIFQDATSKFTCMSRAQRCHKYISHRISKQYIPELCHKHTAVWLFYEPGSVFCITVKIHNLKH